MPNKAKSLASSVSLWKETSTINFVGNNKLADVTRQGPHLKWWVIFQLVNSLLSRHSPWQTDCMTVQKKKTPKRQFCLKKRPVLQLLSCFIHALCGCWWRDNKELAGIFFSFFSTHIIGRGDVEMRNVTIFWSVSLLVFLLQRGLWTLPKLWFLSVALRWGQRKGELSQGSKIMAGELKDVPKHQFWRAQQWSLT